MKILKLTNSDDEVVLAVQVSAVYIGFNQCVIIAVFNYFLF